jgi:autotransporter-associated beta strand protein
VKLRSRVGRGKHVLAALFAVVFAGALPAEAQAFNLTISSSPTTATATVSAGTTTFTATHDGDNIGVTDLHNALATGNAIIDAGSATGSITIQNDIVTDPNASSGGGLTFDPNTPNPIAIDTAAISTNLTQTYNGPVTLAGFTTLGSNSGSASFAMSVDGPGGLQMRTGTEAVFNGDVGAAVPLASISINNVEPSVLNGSSISTTGSQIYDSPMSLTRDATLTSTRGGAIEFTIGISGPQNLVLNTAGPTTLMTVDLGFGSSVKSIITDEPGTTSLDGPIRTTDGQTYADPVTLGDAIVSGPATFAAPISGSGSLFKEGAGTLTLPAANTYAGATHIDQGTLQLTGSLASRVTLASGAALNCDNGTLNGGLTNNGGTATGAPDTPTGVTATSGNRHATVSFTPGAAHCFPVGYIATSAPGAVHGLGAGSPINVSPLTNGTGYRFTVMAANPIGTSTASAPSAPVTPSSNRFGRPHLHVNRDGSISFALKLPGPGALEVLETAAKSDMAKAAALKPAMGRFVFARVTARVKRTRTIRLRIRPDAAGRRLLRHHRHAVLIRLSIRYTPTHGKSRTVVLTGIRLTR